MQASPSSKPESSRWERFLRHLIESVLVLVIAGIGWFVYRSLPVQDMIERISRDTPPSEVRDTAKGVDQRVSRTQKTPPLVGEALLWDSPETWKADVLLPDDSGVRELASFPFDPIAGAHREPERAGDDRMLHGVGIPPPDLIRIHSLQVALRQTPLFHTVTGVTQTRTRGHWLSLQLLYLTGAPWLDEVEVTFFVQVHDKPRGGQPILFARTLVYRNLPRGIHAASVYMHPSSYERYGDPAHVTALIRHRGAEIARITRPERHDRWWDIHEPVEGMLYRARETPFGFVLSDASAHEL